MLCGQGGPYNGDLQALPVFLQSPDSIVHIVGPLDNVLCPAHANVFKNGSELIAGRRLLLHVELKLRTLHFVLVEVIRSLVFGGCLRGLRRYLLEQCEGSNGGLELRLMEEGYDVHRFVLVGSDQQQDISAHRSNSQSET